MIKLSVIIPVYNVEDYLLDCFHSITNQNTDSVEVILVDDGSTDASSDICDKLNTQHTFVTVIKQVNAGLSEARNSGLKVAKGEYILFLDSDDEIETGAIDHIFHALDKEELDVLAYNAKVIKDHKTISAMQQTEIQNTVTGYEYLKTQLMNHSAYMSAWIYLYRRKFLLDNRLVFQPGRLHEDEEFTPRALLKAKKVNQINVSIYLYKIREGSITQTKDYTKNAIHLMKTLNELECLYLLIDDYHLRTLLLDSLVDKALNIFQVGKLLNAEQKYIIDKKFLKRNAHSKKNKCKVSLYIVNRKVYYYLNKIEKRFKNGKNI